MKLFKFCFLLLISNYPILLQAQHSPLSVKHIITTDIVNDITQYFNIQHEIALTPKSSVKYGFGYGNHISRKGGKAAKDFGTVFGLENVYTNKEYIAKGYDINASYRFYISKTSDNTLQELYLNPMLQFMRLKDTYNYSYNVSETEEKFESLELDYSLINLKALFGYQFLFKNIVIPPYTGGGYTIGKTRSKDMRVRLLLDIGLNVGVAF